MNGALTMNPFGLGALSAGAAMMQNAYGQRRPTSIGALAGEGLATGVNTFIGVTDANRKSAQTEALIGLEQQKAKLADAQAQSLARKHKTLEGVLAQFGQQPGALASTDPAIGALTSGAAQGDIGPTLGNAARMDAAPRQPQPSNFPFSIPQMAALKIGADIDLLPYHQASQPQIEFVNGVAVDKRATQAGTYAPGVRDQDLGGSVRRLRTDPQTGADVVLSDTAKTPAPASLPTYLRQGPSGLTVDQTAYNAELGLRGAGAARTITNVNAFTPASETAQREFMDRTAKNFEALQSAPVALQNLSQVRRLAASGNPFIGSFGEQKLAVAQFFNNNFGTSINPDGVADAGELKNRLFQQILENLKKLDAQPSQLQQQIMMDSLGRINTDPGALTKIANVTEEVIRGKVDLHNRVVRDAEGRGVRFPFNPTISLEGPQQQPKPQHGGPRVRRFNPATGGLE